METNSTISIRLIKNLSSRERQRFRDFLMSPYHNTDERLVRLFEQINDAAEHERLEEVSKEDLYHCLFPGKPYHAQKLKDQLSRLSSLTQEFLALEQRSLTPLDCDFQVLDALKMRGATELFTTFHHRLEKKIENLNSTSIETLKARYRLVQLADELESTSKSRKYSQKLQMRSDLTDEIFFIRKLQQYCEILNRNNIYQQHDEPSLLPNLQRILEEHQALLEQPAISLWYSALQTLLQPDQIKVLERLLQELEQTGAALVADEQQAIYKYALNFCIRQINAGKSDYLRISFRIYRQMLEAGLLHQDGFLSHTDAKNMVTSGLRLQEFEWVESFISRIREEVAKPYSENVHAFCLAYLYAETGRKQDAMRLLQEVKFTDAYYSLSARNLLLRIFFELKDFESLGYQITAFEVFLRRNSTISPRNRKLHLNFARHLKKLSRFADGLPYFEAHTIAKRKSKLMEQFSGQEEIPNREWLVQQLHSLA